MNPSIEGNALRISIPPLSAEQRQKLAGRIKSLAEETRISMRNVRRDCIKEVESASKDKKREDAVSEDDVRQAKDEVQSLLKEHEGQIEDLLASKTKEILDL